MARVCDQDLIALPALPGELEECVGDIFIGSEFICIVFFGQVCRSLFRGGKPGNLGSGDIQNFGEICNERVTVTDASGEAVVRVFFGIGIKVNPNANGKNSGSHLYILPYTDHNVRRMNESKDRKILVGGLGCEGERPIVGDDDRNGSM